MSDKIKEAIDVLKKATANCVEGTDAIVVLDRGWIFHGSLSYDPDTDVYTLVDCVNVRKWSSGGFGALSKGAKNAGATLDCCDDIKFKSSALIFSVPTNGGWRNG